MKKPRIIILMHYMELGGAESALIGLLTAFDYNRVDVDLFIHAHRGPLMAQIPARVNLLPEVKAYSMIEASIKEVVRNGCLSVAWARIKAKMRHRRYAANLNEAQRALDASEFQYVAECVERYLPDINPDIEYDLCISFMAPHNYALNKVRANKYLAWIHTDYEAIHINTAQELPMWGGYDYIASISSDVTKSFCKRFPKLSDKIIEIENIIPAELIRNRSDYDVDVFEKDYVNLLSVGRFCEAKNYDNVPDIAKRMVEAGLNRLRWYIIGFGNEALIRKRIVESGMEKHVFILGKKENPYPYIKACDIYVQPSRYEGKSVTVREAQILCKPVAVTAYPTAPSQIRDGIDGVIVPLDNEDCARGLAEFIANKDQQEKMTDYLSVHDYSGQAEVEKIYSLMR